MTNMPSGQAPKAWLPCLIFAACALFLHAVIRFFNGHWSLSLLTSAIVGGLSLSVWRSHLEEQNVRKEMQAHMQEWLNQQFGTQQVNTASHPATSQGAFNSMFKSHRMLRQQMQFVSPGFRSDTRYLLDASIMLVDEKQQHWLVLFASQRERGTEQPIDLRQQPVQQALTELRARRALFNDPAAYQSAFGEVPSKEGLYAWRQKHPEQEQQE